jgi:hypothetical protein
MRILILIGKILIGYFSFGFLCAIGIIIVFFKINKENKDDM